MGVFLQQDDQAILWGAILRDDREVENMATENFDTAKTIQLKYDG